MKYAGVIVDISHEKLDKTFSYRIPEHLASIVEIGSRVRIPFGKTMRIGYVIEITDVPGFDEDKIRDIDSIVEGSVSIDERMIRLAYWMKTNYGSTINRALKTVIPVKKAVKAANKKTVRLLISPQEAICLSGEYAHKRMTAQARILEALSECSVTEYTLLTEKLNVSASSVKALEDKGLIELESITVFRNSLKSYDKDGTTVTLNEEQLNVVQGIEREIDSSDMTPCLIKGVTGSGKTEVYMEIIDHVLKQGKEAIMLIPEIALTYQTVMRFYKRFGEQISIVHSRLSDGEKYDRFKLAKEGRIKVMIGPRSALFTPFSNLGLIVIDEEHESAYQCENVPKYHARETAIALAEMTGGKVILGSATPSMESYYRALNGDFHLYELKNRAGKGTIPKVEIVDLRKELKSGNRSVFSEKLLEYMEDRLSKKQQIMLFLNRRGYEGFINCRECGNVIQCPHCAVSLSRHFGNRLICHYCGYETPFISRCPECGSPHIGTFKAGTQKIEEETLKFFPDASVLRMDLDTTKGKDGHEKILSRFANHEADILIGTQMIVKGHDFPDVTLVGILLADVSLHASDYMASERTFQLLTQAAGRAGRGESPGNVVIQSYDPDNYSIVHAAKQDFEGFYKEEIEYRKLMEYPPVSHMMSVKIASKDEEKAKELSFCIKDITTVDEKVRVIGPANASIYKINDIFYRVIYYKNSDYSILTGMKDIIESYIKEHEEQWKNCLVQFDFR